LGPLELTFCHFDFSVSKSSSSAGFKVSGRMLVRPPLAAGGTRPKTGLIAYLPRAVMIASATFFGASL
ncbi:hypothetical protein, partial [Aquincola tertiaricarbonis]|uniref:hypothetical protein n=1 Tax=Aquincola tertiaricarbonis TaxID=391953 RepID=UPI001E5EB757